MPIPQEDLADPGTSKTITQTAHFRNRMSRWDVQFDIIAPDRDNPSCLPVKKVREIFGSLI